ncbi:MAG: DoxX family membrane protein [Desulfobacterales bacterium]|nr:DoxX family membrane protein [Desulfobacterales bacterium]
MAGKRKVIPLINIAEKLYHARWFELIVRWALGIILLYACHHKILAPAQFAKIIYGYYLFPDFSINLIAIVLPYLELFSGLALILGIYPRSAALIANFMLAFFITALSINLIRGHEFDCGCFSFSDPGHPYSTAQLIVRDIVYFLFGLHVLLFDKRRSLCIRQTGSIWKNMSTRQSRLKRSGNPVFSGNQIDD